MTVAKSMELDNYGHIMSTLEKVGNNYSMQFTNPHKTRGLKVGEVMARLAVIMIEAPPMRIMLTYKWEALESPWHYTTVECTWGRRADLQKLLTEAATFPNVEIGGQEDQGRAWLTQIKNDAGRPGLLSNLKCPDITVQYI